jgi:hypothetical protein
MDSVVRFPGENFLMASSARIVFKSNSETRHLSSCAEEVEEVHGNAVLSILIKPPRVCSIFSTWSSSHVVSHALSPAVARKFYSENHAGVRESLASVFFCPEPQKGKKGLGSSVEKLI